MLQIKSSNYLSKKSFYFVHHAHPQLHKQSKKQEAAFATSRPKHFLSLNLNLYRFSSIQLLTPLIRLERSRIDRIVRSVLDSLTVIIYHSKRPFRNCHFYGNTFSGFYMHTRMYFSPHTPNPHYGYTTELRHLCLPFHSYVQLL